MKTCGIGQNKEIASRGKRKEEQISHIAYDNPYTKLYLHPEVGDCNLNDVTEHKEQTHKDAQIYCCGPGATGLGVSPVLRGLNGN